MSDDPKKTVADKPGSIEESVDSYFKSLDLDNPAKNSLDGPEDPWQLLIAGCDPGGDGGGPGGKAQPSPVPVITPKIAKPSPDDDDLWG